MLVTHRRHGGAKAAVVFVHGYGGDPAKTWGAFPSLVARASELSDWDVLSLGYTTRLVPDLLGLWRGDPDLRLLATHLITRLSLPPLRDYDALAVVATAWAGWSSSGRCSTTPRRAEGSATSSASGRPAPGWSRRAGPAGGGRRCATWRPVAGSSATCGRTGTRRSVPVVPFCFAALAGDMDRFVPASSSLDPFDAADQSVVLGDHLLMVKPDDARSLSVSFVVDRLVGRAAPAGPWNAARVAAETLQFQRAVDLLEPHAAELDDAHLVLLALALDEIGRREDAIRVLRGHAAAGPTRSACSPAGSSGPGRRAGGWLTPTRRSRSTNRATGRRPRVAMPSRPPTTASRRLPAVRARRRCTRRPPSRPVRPGVRGSPSLTATGRWPTRVRLTCTTGGWTWPWSASGQR